MRSLRPYRSEIGVAVSQDTGATWEQRGTALRDPGRSLSSPFAVYDAASRSYVMLPEDHSIAARDGGILAYQTTREDFPLGWRRTTQDGRPAADTAAAGRSATPARRLGEGGSGSGAAMAQASTGTAASATTDADASADSESAAASHAGDATTTGEPWGPPLDRGQRYENTVAVQLQGRWWIFTTLLQPHLLPWLPPRPTPLVFLADGSSLLSPWRRHPVGPLPSPDDASSTTAAGSGPLPSRRASGPGWLRPAGRPVVWRGTLHRWAHLCFGGADGVCDPELLLLAATAANGTHFEERVVARYAPGGDRSWHAKRLGHVDVWPQVLAAEDDGSQGAERWTGLVSGDRYSDGMHHFLVHEMWFVELKAQLRNLVAAQLVLVLTALAVQSSASAHRHHHHDRGDRPDRAAERSDRAGGGGGKAASRGNHHHHTSHKEYHATSPRGDDACDGGGGVEHFARPVRGGPGLAGLLVGLLVAWADRAARLVYLSLVRIAAWWDAMDGAVRRVAAQPAVQFLAQVVGACAAALAVAAAAMVLAPSAVPCPRWTVVVKPFASSPHFVPEKPYVDPAAPYDVSNLTLVSGCTMSFMDRLENLVGSLQYWEPRRPIVLYDLGFTSAQLAQARCWRDVSVVRFPYEDYPAHVREIGNYAFKPLVFQHALRHHGAMLWVDCGLEVRGPLDSMRSTLARSGHVSAQQSMAPADFPYTEQYTVPFFKFPPAEYERVKHQPFCAGGLQGFVPGSAAERLVLQPAVQCALDANCISPPGHTQKKHMYDQTALTLHIRLHNFSSCMPRETHCTSAVKKTSWDASSSSDPIVIASRRHRWPKPYQHRVASRPQCLADPAANPWRSVSSEHPETVTKSSSLLFKVGYVYGQAAGDLLIQASCCLGFHLLAQSVLAALLIGSCAYRYGSLPRRSPQQQLQQQQGGSATCPSPPSLEAHSSQGSGGGGSLLWPCRLPALIAALVVLVVLMGLSLVTTCRAE